MPGYKKNEMDIASINKDFSEGRLYADPSYQRRKVWNNVDKVRLIETILMHYVIPEVFFWHVSRDLETGLATTHIVDGQQRIAAIVDFINGEYPLTKRFLMDKDIAEKYGDMYFSDLDAETKNSIWGFQLTVITLDDDYNIDTIKNMFYRLNLTNYNLNSQERRHSQDSVFGDKCSTLSEVQFWNTVRVFSSRDYMRMLDVEFCATIYILANEFIVNQVDNTVIDHYYEDYSKEFDQDDALTKKIYDSMSLIEKLLDNETISFVSKKVQLYTLFSLTMEMVSQGKDVDDDLRYRFIRFCTVYSKFKNEYVFEGRSEATMSIYDKVKQYKLASSEGVNKIKNRMIRFETMWEFLFSETYDDNLLTEIETFFDEERKKMKLVSLETDGEQL